VGTTNPGLSPREGRPDNGAAAAYVGELFAAHGRMVLGLCRLLLRDPVEAEDAAQQVFVSAQRALVGGASIREPAAWLATIARNECRARIRARMREPLALPELPADIPDPLASAIHAADLDALWAALSVLPRRQRNAFLLRELGGLSYGELGAALGVTRPAVESLLFRARQQLRSALGMMNTALVPVALREQLLRFLPAGTPSSGGAPFAAKAAAVTVGVGLGAAGAVELPERHAHHAVTHAPAVAPLRVYSESEAAALLPAAAATRASGERPSGHGPGAPQSDERGPRTEPADGPDQEAQVEAPEQEHSAPSSAEASGHDGDGGSGDHGDGGSSETPGSGSDGGHGSPGEGD
jgi:RNA polymerase sigma factor (sigma-70 family)